MKDVIDELRIYCAGRVSTSAAFRSVKLDRYEVMGQSRSLEY